MKLHAQNQLYTSVSFRDLKVSPLWACLDMPDHTYLKSHHQFVALIDVNLNVKNQLYSSNSFRDIKV